MALALAALAMSTASDADSVTSLPLYGKPPAPQWSGFLDASAAEPGT